MKAAEKTWFAHSAERSLGALAGFGSALAVVLCLFAIFASTGSAAEHTVITGEYGKEGPKATGVGNGCHIAYDSAGQKLYLSSDGQIYGLAINSPNATKVAGSPFNVGVSSGCGDPDMEVDSSGSGRIFAVQSGAQVYGFKPNGEAIGPPWPVSPTGGGEVCGVETTATGEVWAMHYQSEKIFKYTAAGVANGTISVPFRDCKFAVNRANGDVFALGYNNGGQVVKITAASGYTTQETIIASGVDGNGGLAVNGNENKLYIASGGNTVKVYDTNTKALVETVNLPGSASRGIAVDEATDTLFVTIGSGDSGYIVEYLGVTTPKATTGEPTGNSSVSGTADPNGVGPITECYFEYGTDTNYEVSPGVKGKQSCDEAMPINSVQEVHATFSGLTGEETYHYRLVLDTGKPHVVGKGGDKTIVPHNVKGLATQPATEIKADSALLNASFEGDGTETTYYFEWGQTTKYGHKTPIPPASAGSPTGLTNVPPIELPNLDEGTTYHYRVIGENTTGISGAKDQSFTTHEKPSIDSATTSHLTATSADVDITINPHEFETKYFVKYGPTLDYGLIAPIPSGTIAPANTAQGVTVPLTGLSGVQYHFRVVAENEWGQVETEDQSFNFFPQDCPNSTIRQQNESQYLPDCRAFELVSPSETGNVVLGNSFGSQNTFASNPPRFAFTGGLGGIKGNEPINGCSSDTYVATRSPSGWTSSLVGIRGFEAQSNSSLFANEDYTRFLNFIEPPCFEGVAQPPHNIPYIFDLKNNLLERWPEDFESVPKSEASTGAFQPSPDLKHMAFTSTNAAFTSDGLTTGIGSAYDYNSETQTTTLISLDEEGNPIQQEPGVSQPTTLGIFFPVANSNPNNGGYVVFDNGNTGFQKYQRPDPVNPPVSTDGSHILMATTSANYSELQRNRPPVRLYMAVERGDHFDHYDVSGKKDVNYAGMTPDGTKVFFTSPEQLTGDDTDTSVDLYMWAEATNDLTLISKGAPLAEGTGNSDDCSVNFAAKCGVVPVLTRSNSDNTISDDGQIFFFSPEQLDGTKGVPNRENLFTYREGSPQFVASLDPTPNTEQAPGPVSRMQVGADGNRMALITKSRLTGYDNAGKDEMYVYDAITRKIFCASCRPDGKAPKFNVQGSKAGRFMSDDGRAFFSTEDALLLVDTNEALDVYEYTEGRPQLITTGSGTTESGAGIYGGLGSPPESVGLAGVSADGVDVYFATLDVLVPQNKNGPFLAFYDARTNGGFPYVPPLAPCEAADECHGAGNAAPARPGVASEGDLGDRGNAPDPSPKKKKAGKAKKHKKAKKHRRHHRHQKARHQRQGGN